MAKPLSIAPKVSENFLIFELVCNQMDHFRNLHLCYDC